MDRRDFLKVITLAATALGIPLTTEAADKALVGDKVVVDIEKVRSFINSHPDVPTFDYNNYVCKCTPGMQCFCLPPLGKPIAKINTSTVNRVEGLCYYYSELGTGIVTGEINLNIVPNKIDHPDKQDIQVPFYRVQFPEKKLTPPVDPQYWERWRVVNYTPTISIHPSFLKKV